MRTDLRLGLGTKLVVWLTVYGVCVLPTNLNLEFSSAVSCTPQEEQDSQGMGFTKSTQLPAFQGEETLTSLQAPGSTGKMYAFDHRVNTSDNTLQNLLQVGVNTISQPFEMSTWLKSPFTIINTAKQQVALEGFSTELAASPSFATIDWSINAPSPLPRGEGQTAVVNRKLYVFGGYLRGDVLRFVDAVDVYNPANNSWTRLAKKMPKPLTHSGTTEDGENVYLAGGYIGKSNGGTIFATTDVWRYNVGTNTWTAMPPLPEARGSGALELLGRKLHFFGGSNIRRADERDHWVLSLDNLKQGWTQAAPLPNPRNHLGDAVLDGKLYAIGGQVGQDNESVTKTSVYRWNPATNTWTEVDPLPRPRSHISGATFVMDGRIIVVGGEDRHAHDIPDVTAYNPLSNSWKALTPLPTPRRSGVAGAIGNQIFFTTGYNTTTFKGKPTLTFPAQSRNLQIAGSLIK